MRVASEWRGAGRSLLACPCMNGFAYPQFGDVLQKHGLINFAAHGTRTARRRVSSVSSACRLALTAREIEVLRWIQCGKRNADRAVARIVPVTVKNHVQRILRKPNAQNRAQAVVLAITQHLISVASSDSMRGPSHSIRAQTS